MHRDMILFFFFFPFPSSVTASSSVNSWTNKSSSFTCAELHIISSNRTVPVLCCLNIWQSSHSLLLPVKYHLKLLFRALIINIHWLLCVFLTFKKSLFFQLFSYLPPLLLVDKYIWFFLLSFHSCSFPLVSTDILHVYPTFERCLTLNMTEASISAAYPNNTQYMWQHQGS